MAEPHIEWKTATVSAFDRSLTVGFSTVLPPGFLDVVREVAKSRSREVRGPWGEVGVQFNQLIHVRSVEEGAEDGLKRELQSMVEAASSRFARLEQERSQQAGVDREKQAQDEAAAKRMQEHFRS